MAENLEIEYLSTAAAGKPHYTVNSVNCTLETDDGKGTKFWRLAVKTGEDLFATLQKFVEEDQVISADYSGIGAATNIRVGWLDLKREEYKVANFTGQYELTSILGNIGLNAETRKPAIHTHINFSDSEYNSHGGHLISAIANPTMELEVITYDKEVLKKKDSKSGLFLY